jgi:hypothetical protein
LQREEASDYETQDIIVVAGAILAGGRRIRRWDAIWAVYQEALKYFELLDLKNRRRAQLDALKLVRH